jgi:hypothetical protein
MPLLKTTTGFLLSLLGFFLLCMTPLSLLSGYAKTGGVSAALGIALLAVAFWLKISRMVLPTLLILNLVGFTALYVLTISGMRLLPKKGYVSIDEVTTIEDAVEACRGTNLGGWELVAYAQNLTARKFSYSRRNPWDSPSRTFERGLGYCQQQALALKEIYGRLGISSGVVYATKCKFPPSEGCNQKWCNDQFQNSFHQVPESFNRVWIT